MRTDLPLAAFDGTEHFTPEHHLVLWESIPAGLRHLYFTIPRIPAEYLGAFKANGDRGRAIDLRMLPEPIAHELSFCVWRIVELGGLVPHEPLDRFARHLAASAGCAAGGRARSPVLADGRARDSLDAGAAGGVDTRTRPGPQRCAKARPDLGLAPLLQDPVLRLRRARLVGARSGTCSSTRGSRAASTSPTGRAPCTSTG